MFRNFLLNLHINNNRLLLASKLSKSNILQTASITSTNPSDYILEQEHIDEACKLNPTLSSLPVETWQQAHETFVSHGLYTTNFLRIAVGNPAVLRRSPKKNIESLEYWRSCQFGEKLLHLLITKYPELLDVTNPRKLMVHINFLRGFVGTNKNVWKLLMNSPDLLEQPQQKIKEKFDYLRLVMRIEVSEIIKSEALSKSLEEIRCRHVFQERLGIFKPRPLKADPNEPTTNSRLYQITDTSEKAFATKICHVPLVEYEAFKELYARELKRKRKEADQEEDGDLSEED